MNYNKRILKDASTLKVLAEQFSKCHEVSKFDKEGYSEAWTLAHNFSDLEQSFRNILDIQLPRLVSEKLGESEVNDVMLRIGEELRHILYHIKESEFYRYLEINDANGPII